MTNNIWLTQTAAQVAVQRALTNTNMPTIRHGTVVRVDYGVFIHEVQLDEPGGVSIRAHDVTILGVGLGDRVTVLFAPPHQALIIGSPVHDAWHLVGTNGNIPFTTGWGNNGTAGELDTQNYPKVMFRRDGTFVHIRGSAENFSAVTNTIFTMPEGYRPRNSLILTCCTTLGAYAVVQVNRDGTVVAQGGASPIFFHGIHYSIL